jgi:hypothetical protein
MSNKVLSKEEQRTRLKNELEKTKIRLLNAYEKNRVLDNQLKVVTDELDYLNNLKLIMEAKADNISLLFVHVIIGFSCLLVSFPISTLVINLGIKHIVTVLYYWVATFLNISIFSNWNDLVHKFLPKFEKIVNKRLKKSKKYQELLIRIKMSENKVAVAKNEIGKCGEEYHMAFMAERSLSSKIYNFYNRDNVYEYVNGRYKYVGDRRHYKPKPLSSIKAKKKLRAKVK